MRQSVTEMLILCLKDTEWSKNRKAALLRDVGTARGDKRGEGFKSHVGL